jgi:hypothetical protein
MYMASAEETEAALQRERARSDIGIDENREQVPIELYARDFPDTNTRQSNGNGAGESGPVVWKAPPVTTYGKGFDAATIPQRQWLLGRRRSVSEVTVDAGPPGTNKSTLMLTDAVSITTGRRILDYVHRTGGALFLAGEDARRDVEARLAGILTRYHIAPSELSDHLHIVYLAETDFLGYSLADMVDDIAVLNEHMLIWLRELLPSSSIRSPPGIG